MNLSLLLRLLRTEGVPAVRDRLLDRWQERRRSSLFAPLASAFHADVLNVLATPPVPRLGGLQVQLLTRLDEEAKRRVCALLYAEGGSYRLEVQDGSRRESGLLRTSGGFAAAVRAAAERVGARLIHLEGLADVPLVEALSLPAGTRLVVSVHDFAAFCPRPHLLAHPELAFCGYCRDLQRCYACLRHDFDVDAGFQAVHRAQGAALLSAASAIVFPSAFLRDAWRGLVANLDARRQRVIPPVCAVLPPAAPPRARPVAHVAYVGAVNVQKGAGVFEQLVRSSGPGVRWSAYGKGDSAALLRLRALRDVKVRGYYRTGTLPALLARHQVDLALVLSITPESYGLTSDECMAAGVPVIAFDHGAVAERLRTTGAGGLVPLADGWQGIAAAIEAHRSGQRRLGVPAGLRFPQASSTADAWGELYRDLLAGQ